jgi:hypothetical protein
VIAGIAYIKFTDYDVKDSAAIKQKDTSPVTSLPEPHKPRKNQVVSASIDSLLSPVKPGENTTVTAATLADSMCTITVTYGVDKSKDSGLAAKQADAYGRVTWSWTVEKSVAPGKYPVQIVCKHDSKSAMVIGYLVVKK